MAQFMDILKDIVNTKYPDIVLKHAEVMDATAIDHASRTSGDGSPGSVDTYTLWKDAEETEAVGTFTVYNGNDASAAGDMTKAVYDPDGVAADAFDMENMKDGATKKAMTVAERDKLAGIEEGANHYVLPLDVVHDADYVHTDNNYTDAEKAKLGGIEEGATADQTGEEIKALYEAEPDTNAYTDAEKSKLAGIEDNANNYTLPGDVVHNTDFATATVGGVVKMRVEGNTLYIRNDGQDA